MSILKTVATIVYLWHPTFDTFFVRFFSAVPPSQLPFIIPVEFSSGYLTNVTAPGQGAVVVLILPAPGTFTFSDTANPTKIFGSIVVLGECRRESPRNVQRPHNGVRVRTKQSWNPDETVLESNLSLLALRTGALLKRIEIGQGCKNSFLICRVGLNLRVRPYVSTGRFASSVVCLADVSTSIQRVCRVKYRPGH